MTFDYYYHNSCYRKDKYYYSEYGNINDWVKIIDKLYDVNMLSPIWNKVFKRDILVQKCLFFNSKMFIYEDLEFSIRYLAYCDLIYNFSDCIYHYRQAEDEGNASRRLMRIEHLADIVNSIEDALDLLIEKKNVVTKELKIKGILLDLYCIIAKEKIMVANRKEIKKICNEFVKWSESKSICPTRKNQKMVYQLLKQRVFYFIFVRVYVKYRHELAIRIKKQKWYHFLKCLKGGEK